MKRNLYLIFNLLFVLHTFNLFSAPKKISENVEIPLPELSESLIDSLFEIDTRIYPGKTSSKTLHQLKYHKKTNYPISFILTATRHIMNEPILDQRKLIPLYDDMTTIIIANLLAGNQYLMKPAKQLLKYLLSDDPNYGSFLKDNHLVAYSLIATLKQLKDDPKRSTDYAKGSDLIACDIFMKARLELKTLRAIDPDVEWEENAVEILTEDQIEEMIIKNWAIDREKPFWQSARDPFNSEIALPLRDGNAHMPLLYYQVLFRIVKNEALINETCSELLMGLLVILGNKNKQHLSDILVWIASEYDFSIAKRGFEVMILEYKKEGGHSDIDVFEISKASLRKISLNKISLRSTNICLDIF
ncbi:MAG: hypothetical protein ABIA04_13115 [Pseudomonadota bacterium]